MFVVLANATWPSCIKMRDAILILLTLPTEFDGSRAGARAGGTCGIADPRMNLLVEACDCGVSIAWPGLPRPVVTV